MFFKVRDNYSKLLICVISNFSIILETDMIKYNLGLSKQSSFKLVNVLHEKLWDTKQIWIKCRGHKSTEFKSHGLKLYIALSTWDLEWIWMIYLEFKKKHFLLVCL